MFDRLLVRAAALPILGLAPPVLGGRQADGQRLNIRLNLFAQMAKQKLSIDQPPSAVARRHFDRSMAAACRVPGLRVADSVVRVPDATGAHTGAILHRPVSDAHTLLVWVHGGGWFIGSAEGYRGTTRVLADSAGMNVLSLDYRLAPAHPFPAAFDDVVAGYRFAVDHARELGALPGRVGIGGDSAGANIAAAVALSMSGDPRYRPAFLGLWYPIVDHRLDRYRSTALFSAPLDRAIVERSMRWYAARPEDRADPRCFVMAADDLSGLPPTLVAAAGVDVLRDQAAALADRLTAAGVPVVSTRGENLPHGYLGALFDANARAETERTARTLAGLAGSPLGSGGFPG
ncbi:alpha/beta hydrolase [Bacillus cereus]|uniref:alpha/beta hydrolase n=1 Tax=Bacillus cereus TaxID=1396 RepID=UPI003670AC47